MKRRLWVPVAVIAAMLGLQTSAARADLPVVFNGVLGWAHTSSTASPPGSNDWSCKPTATHPRPVVLVHGTLADRSNTWQAISPLLKNDGYCVFALNYGDYEGSGAAGVYGLDDIPTSAGELGVFVDKVLRATGAAEVDVVGHSQGGMMPRYYLAHLGGAARVHTLVGLSPDNHGLDLGGPVLLFCPACEQQQKGSAFIADLNSPAETVPGVDYTVVVTRFDPVVQPYTSAFLSGPRVKNILLQDQCALDFGDHLSMPYDHIVAADVLTALDPAHPHRPRCSLVLPTTGG